jgi:hypothetical protein
MSEEDERRMRDARNMRIEAAVAEAKRAEEEALAREIVLGLYRHGEVDTEVRRHARAQVYLRMISKMAATG